MMMMMMMIVMHFIHMKWFLANFTRANTPSKPLSLLLSLTSKTQASAGFSYFHTIVPYIFIIFLLSTLTPQIMYMNLGLAEFAAIHYVPICEFPPLTYPHAIFYHVPLS